MKRPLFPSTPSPVLFAALAMPLLHFLYNGLPPVLPQEAYYWDYAKHLDWSYFDHPPMVAWSIALGTFLGGDSAYWLRLCGALYGLGTSVVLWLFCRDLLRTDDTRASANEHLAAAIVLAANLSPVFFLQATVLTPDAPLGFFWALAAYAFYRAMHGAGFGAWAVFGVAQGCALLSKYTAVFLGAGALAFLVASGAHRRWFRRPHPYVAALLVVLVFSPVIYWNATHQWASFRFQSSDRAATWTSFEPRFFRDLVLTQTALLSPVFAFLLGVVAVRLGRFVARHYRWRELDTPTADALLLALLSLPLILFFASLSLVTLVKPNWIGPAYFALFPGIAWCVARATDRGGEQVRWLRHLRSGAVVGAVFLLLLHAFVFLPVAPSRRGDTWTGWKEATEKTNELRTAWGNDPFVFSNEYKVSSEIRFHDPAHRETYGGNVLGAPGLQYEFWTREEALVGRDGLLVISDAWPLSTDQRRNLAERFRVIEGPEEMEIRRRGVVFRRFQFYRCRDFRGRPPAKPPLG